MVQGVAERVPQGEALGELLSVPLAQREELTVGVIETQCVAVKVPLAHALLQCVALAAKEALAEGVGGSTVPVAGMV